MTEKKKYLGLILALIAVFLIVQTPGQSSPQYPNFQEIKLPTKTLTQEDYLADFEVLYDTLRHYYPFFVINQELNQIDWLAQKEKYQEKIKQVKTDQGFKQTLQEILSDLNNHHTYVLDERVGYKIYTDYREYFSKEDWRYKMVELFHKPAVVKRYELTNGLVASYIDAQKQHLTPINQENLEVKDLVDQKIAYIKIPQMLAYERSETQDEILLPYLSKITNYKALVVDIRGNGGGDSQFWTDYFLPKLLSSTQKQTITNYMVHGKLTQQVLVQEGYTSYQVDLYNKYLSQFDYTNQFDLVVYPSSESIKFKGKIFLIVDEKVYSSAESMAIFMKETQLATIIGTKTGGDGIGTDPMLFDLPNTGYVISFAKSLGSSAAGINELVKTIPDHEVNFDQVDFVDVILNLLKS